MYHRESSVEYQRKVPGKPGYFRPSADFEIEKCSKEAYTDLIVPTMRYFFPNGLCFKHKDKVTFSGNFQLAKNANKYFGVFACNKNIRKTCKTRK